MTRRLSKLEMGILAIASRNCHSGDRNGNDMDVAPEEVLEAYFAMTFKPGFEKVGNTYEEHSLPADKNLAARYTRATVAIWWAFCRLEDRQLLESFWKGLGSAVWCAGGCLTSEGCEIADSLPPDFPNKRRWGGSADENEEEATQETE